ncbi:hypothetical protein D3C76_1776670 [compost metagenome]
MHGFKHYHQFSGGTFLMQFQAIEQAQVGFDRVEHLRSGKYNKTGDMQGFVHERLQ